MKSESHLPGIQRREPEQDLLAPESRAELLNFLNPVGDEMKGKHRQTNPRLETQKISLSEQSYPSKSEHHSLNPILCV